MVILEKIVHSDAYTVNIYKEGIFWIAYEQSAYYIWQKKGYKLTKKFIKQIRQEVVNCGFPQNALDSFVCENEKSFTLTTDMPHLKTFLLEKPIDLDAFEEWKNELPLASFNGGSTTNNVPDAQSHTCDLPQLSPFFEGGYKEFIDKLLAFPLADKTPMECMFFLSGLQKELVNACK
jgi:hypothetical protein